MGVCPISRVFAIFYPLIGTVLVDLTIACPSGPVTQSMKSLTAPFGSPLVKNNEWPLEFVCSI